jgi:hypothetical protein
VSPKSAIREKRGVGFAEAQAAYLDPDRLIFAGTAHGGLDCPLLRHSLQLLTEAIDVAEIFVF